MKPAVWRRATRTGRTGNRPRANAARRKVERHGLRRPDGVPSASRCTAAPRIDRGRRGGRQVGDGVGGARGGLVLCAPRVELALGS